MKNTGLLLQVLFLAIVTAGCSRDDQRAVDTPPGSKAQAVGTSTSGERPEGWTFHSQEHAFSFQLPSAGWKQIAKGRFIADFWCRTGTGSAMLAGVTSVKKQTRDQFQMSIPPFKANADKGGDYLLNPTFQEGMTAAGNPYVYAALCEKGDAASQFIYAATAAVWLADKGITVTTLFEGQGQMRSMFFKAVEYAEFEAAAKSICLSPK